MKVQAQRQGSLTFPTRAWNLRAVDQCESVHIVQTLMAKRLSSNALEQQVTGFQQL